MLKKTSVGFAFFFAISALLAWPSIAGAKQEQAPQAQNGNAQGTQPAATAPAASQPATAPATGQQAAAAKAGFTDDVKPYLSDRHIAKGLQCTSCHGDVTPQKPVETAKCLECHKSFDEISKKTEDMSPNPHSNHLVESQDVDCNFCHHAHKANEIGCTQCHADMVFERGSAQ